MATLDEILQRPGLAPADRLLVRSAVAVWPGDREMLTSCIAHYRSVGGSRADLEEVLLQSILFCGFPRTINAFQALHDSWPAERPPSGGALPTDAQMGAGDAIFRTIYGDNSEPVKSMLRSHHAELHEFVLDTAYGRILSRPGLAPKIRELMAIAVLAHTNQVPQLVAHGRGARRFGATTEEISEAIFTGCEDETYAAGMIRRINRG